MKNFSYVQPDSLEQAATAAMAKGALLKSGGIDVLDLLKAGVIEPDSLVNLVHLKTPALREISEKDDGLHIGALVTLAKIAEGGLIPGPLSQAAGLAATPQIRNVATVGGNLAQRVRCWWFRSASFPCARKEGNQCYAQKTENKYHALFDNGDCAAVHASSLASPLVALDATVVTNKRRIPIEQFFVTAKTSITREHVLDSGEIITELFIPKSAKGWKAAYREAAERDSQDWALVSASVALQITSGTIEQARVVLGQVAVTPLRAKAVEAALKGQAATAKNIEKAVALAFAKATPFAENTYTIPLGKAILRRALSAAAGLPEMGA